jgi:hypothetical protein
MSIYRLTCLGAALALLAGGCGGGESESGGVEIDTADVEHSFGQVFNQCNNAMFGQGSVDDSSISVSVDTILRAYQTDPEAPVRTEWKGGTIREALENAVGFVEDCSPESADRIHEALAAG